MPLVLPPDLVQPTRIRVRLPGPPTVVRAAIPSTPARVTVVPVAGSPGPQGPPGADGAGHTFEYVQATPLATWVIPVPVQFSRRPSVDVYVAGELVDADITATATQAVISFAFPVAGSAVLT